MPIAGKSGFRLARRMAAQDLLRQYYEMMMESQYWAPEQLLAFQRQQLAQLLRHARAQSPFYEHRLDAVLRADGGIDWDRWSEIPILKRSDLLEHRDQMLACQLPPGHGPVQEVSTSGSTGAPARIATTVISSVAGRASVWRMQRWHEMDWSRHMVSWMGEDERSARPEGHSAGRWGPPWMPHATGELFYVSRTWPPAQVLEFVERIGAAYLTGRPKSMQYLALDALQHDARLPLHGMLCFGTGISADEREDCSAAFGAEMWSHYSSKEMGPIAHQCSGGRHLHVNAESVLVEIVDEAGRAVPPGEAGLVVATSIYSTAQPLIRYEQGDLAVADAGGCGRTLPVLEAVTGRVTNLFRFPDGARVAPSVPDHYRSLLGAKYWQIAQVGPLELEVRYVPFDGPAADEAAFAEVVRQHIHRKDVSIRFAARETLERAAGGKFVQYVCELPN
ncbi:MAG: AMP-binding protein [Devosia sp.]